MNKYLIIELVDIDDNKISFEVKESIEPILFKKILIYYLTRYNVKPVVKNV